MRFGSRLEKVREDEQKRLERHEETRRRFDEEALRNYNRLIELAIEEEERGRINNV